LNNNNLDFFPCLRHVAKAKIDIKNDLKDIRANIIRKEPRKYRFKGIFKGHFYYFGRIYYLCVTPGSRTNNNNRLLVELLFAFK
jgi:hypothetical protein